MADALRPNRPSLADLADYTVTWTMAAGNERRSFTLTVPLSPGMVKDLESVAYTLAYAVNEVSGHVWKITETFSAVDAAGQTVRHATNGGESR